MIDLYINNERIDVDEKAIKQTFQNNNLGEVKDRQANFTNKFKIPKTPRNTKVLGMLSIAGNQSRQQYTNLFAKIVENGIEIVSKGYCYIKSSTPKYYEVVIYSGISSLFERIKEKSILDLNFWAYNHMNSPSAVINSFGNTSGYIYALAAFLQNETVPNDENFYMYASNAWLPSFFEKTIFEMIFNEAGFTFSGIDFDDFVVAPSKGIEQDFEGVTDVLFNDEFDFDSIFNISAPQSSVNHTYSQTLTSFTAPEDGYYNFNIEGDDFSEANWVVAQPNTVGNPSYQTKLYIAIGNSDEEIDLATSSFDVTEFNKDETYSISQGQVVTVFYRMYVGAGTPANSSSVRVKVNADFTLKVGYSTSNLFIDFSQILPDIKQTDFVKEVMQRYGYSMRKVRNVEHYEFKRIEDIITDKDNAEDWSDKLDSVIYEKYKLGNYGQKNIFTYSNQLNQGSFYIDNDLFKKEVTLITSNYQSHVNENIEYNGLIIQPLRIYNVDYEDGFVVAFESIDVGARIFSLKYQNGSIGVGTYKVPDSTQNFSGNIPTLSFDGLDFQIHVNNNYTSFKKVINDAIVMKLRFLLNTIDVYNLDFFKLKYIKQFGAYFYLNKVENYENLKTTKCELIRIPPNLGSNNYYFNPTILSENVVSI